MSTKIRLLWATALLSLVAIGFAALPDQVAGQPVTSLAPLVKKVVTGERHSETSDESGGLKRVERISGKFYRRFSLPETADAEGIAAKSSNGILEVTIPKQPEIKARRITVQAA